MSKTISIKLNDKDLATAKSLSLDNKQIKEIKLQISETEKITIWPIEKEE